MVICCEGNNSVLSEVVVVKVFGRCSYSIYFEGGTGYGGDMGNVRERISMAPNLGAYATIKIRWDEEY